MIANEIANRYLQALLLALAVTTAACTSESPPAGADETAAVTQTEQSVPAITIMTFNVENLFDNRDDPGKNDRTYLPLEMKQSEEHIAACAEVEVERWRNECLNWNWSDDIVEQKLAVVAAAILQVEDGKGPDILALQEIENVKILERLSNEFLEAAHYKPAILIEGEDERGIDVAFLSRLELAESASLHNIRFEGIDDERIADTRGILEATFRLPDGTLLTGYAVHFPAPFHPTAMRIAGYELLNRLQAALPDERPAFAAGDFNTTSEEDREKSMLQRFVRPGWTIAHETGCGACKGTSYYARTDDWSFLDMILWAAVPDRRAEATWGLRANSVAMANGTPAQVRDDGTPARFALPEGRGVSDHWPLVVTVELK